MATMTKAARKAERLHHLTVRVIHAIEQTTGKTPDDSDAIRLVMQWDRAAERLRKRWENECSYEWANTPAYEKATERARDRLIESVKATGLYVYLQSDPRGATLYVDSKPIPADNYTQAICVCLD